MPEEVIKCVYCLAQMSPEDDGCCPECGHLNDEGVIAFNYFNTQTGPYDD